MYIFAIDNRCDFSKLESNDTKVPHTNNVLLVFRSPPFSFKLSERKYTLQ